MKRLTVHLANVKKQTIETGKFVLHHKGETWTDGDQDAPKKAKRVKQKRTVLRNTITVGGLSTEQDIKSALSDIRKKHTIAICEDGRRSNWKAGEEMYHTANQK